MPNSLDEAVNLDDPTSIPECVLSELRRYHTVFAKHQSIERLLKCPGLKKITQDLTSLCTDKQVIGYHYTRAIREKIELNGLRISCGDDRRRGFLQQFEHRFTPEARNRIVQLWHNYGYQKSSRDGRLCFDLTLNALTDGKADNLLTYFGGENIYKALIQLPARLMLDVDAEIDTVFQDLGSPLVVKCALDTGKLKYSIIDYEQPSEYMLASIWLSSYHRTLNPKATQHDVTARIDHDVRPDDLRIMVPTRATNSRNSWKIKPPRFPGGHDPQKLKNG